MEPTETIEEYKKRLVESVKFGTQDFIGAAQQMARAANEMTQAFASSRARVGEMMTAVSEAAPRMKRLGADFAETTSSLIAIAQATEKQTLASSDSVAKLYATSQVLGTDIGSIVTKFTDVGIQFGVIGGELEKSVSTVSDLGLNTKKVMSDVLASSSRLNEFNFENGVQGMTKMAARASMLRVDMSFTLDLAEKMMDPEAAVNMASAFQRLGVSSGLLADPFALMNASINDPGALQDSLANVAKQYTFFDEKSKTFKINPQGILTLRAMEKETGLAANTLTKMGLAAAETDKRLSQINPTIKFKDDSDKQFLSNLSEMNASGEYVVKINDSQSKNLADVTQEEFNKLIDEQKKAPKSMEDIARAGMKTSDLIANDVGAIKDAVVRGLVSTSIVKDNMESGRKGLTTPTGILSDKIGKSEIFNKEAEKMSNALRDAAKGLMNGKKKEVVFKELSDKFSDQGKDVKQTLIKLSNEIYEDFMSKDLGYRSGEIGKLQTAAVEKIKKFVEVDSEKPKSGVTNATAKAASAKSRALTLYGTESLSKTSNPNQTLTSAINETTRTSKDDVTFTLKIDAPDGVSTQYLDQIFKEEKFKQMIYTYVEQKNKQLEKTK